MILSKLAKILNASWGSILWSLENKRLVMACDDEAKLCYAGF